MKNTSDNNQEPKEDSFEILEGGLPGDKVIRIKRNPRIQLKRALGVPGIFSIAYGNLGSSIYFSLGVTAAFALGATPIVFIIATIFFIFTTLTYAEGTAAIPEAGGSSSFARQGFNELVSFIAAWCLLLSYTAATGIAAFTAISYLNTLEYFSILKNPLYQALATGGILLFLVIVNIIGIKASNVLNIVLAAVDVATQVFLVIVGAFFFFNLPKLAGQIHWGVAPTWKQFAMGIYMVMLAFIGIETISNLAEESKSPEITIPRSMWWSVAIVFFLFLGISGIALNAMPVTYNVEGYIYSIKEAGEKDDGFKKMVYYRNIDNSLVGVPVEQAEVSISKQGGESTDEITTHTNGRGWFRLTNVPQGVVELNVEKDGFQFSPYVYDNTKDSKTIAGTWETELATKWKNNPINGIADKFPVFGKGLSTWISILGFTLLILATNAGLLGLTRLVFSMGSHKQLPPILAKLHPKSRAPYIAIIVFAFIAFIITLPARLEDLAEVLAFGITISYTIAHVSIIALRIRYPEMRRPYKIPLNINIGGREIPITAILGAIGSFALWIVVNMTSPFGRTVGIPFVILGIIIYIAYRRSRGLSITETIDPRKRS